eukprot:5183452-Prymnesium_polylepis.1
METRREASATMIARICASQSHSARGRGVPARVRNVRGAARRRGAVSGRRREAGGACGYVRASGGYGRAHRIPRRGSATAARAAAPGTPSAPRRTRCRAGR